MSAGARARFTDVKTAATTRRMIETLARQGLQPTGGTPADLADLTSSDLDRWVKVIREANIRAD